jgi:ABC-type cobalamin transport system permease subunit
MQRTIGVVLGALVTYMMLVILGATSSPETKYGLAVVVGALVSWLWPWIIGIILVRRAKARRDQKITDEVDKQVAASKKG